MWRDGQTRVSFLSVFLFMGGELGIERLLSVTHINTHMHTNKSRTEVHGSEILVMAQEDPVQVEETCPLCVCAGAGLE